MVRSVKTEAFLVVPLIVSIIIAVSSILGHFLIIILTLPTSFGFPLAIRLFGVLVLGSGFLLFSWLFKFRKPADIIVSTYVTFRKVKNKTVLGKSLGSARARLAVQGPYQYVRHPLYLNVILVGLGCWLMLDYGFLLISTILLLLWFNFVIAPFEEKELRAIFGKQYEEYSKDVPRIIPFTKHRKKDNPSQS